MEEGRREGRKSIRGEGEGGRPIFLGRLALLAKLNKKPRQTHDYWVKFGLVQKTRGERKLNSTWILS